MIIIYCYLERDNDTVLTIHVNNCSDFEISVLPSKKHPNLKLQIHSSVGELIDVNTVCSTLN